MTIRSRGIEFSEEVGKLESLNAGIVLPNYNSLCNQFPSFWIQNLKIWIALRICTLFAKMIYLPAIQLGDGRGSIRIRFSPVFWIENDLSPGSTSLD
jgi:hypothetical protein